MADVDLIPRAWRELRRARRTLRSFGIALVVLTLGLAGSRVAMDSFSSLQQREAKELSERKSAVRARITATRALEARRAALDQVVQDLDRLTNARLARDVLVPVDRALNARVWFDELVFTRTLVDTRHDSDATRRGESPRLRTSATLEIRGKALDHASLAELVDALGAQPQFRDLRLVGTRVHRYTELQVLDFSLEASVIESEPTRS